MLTLKDFQQTAVDKLLDATKAALRRQAHQQVLLLKAPTGSGKTVMTAAYLRALFADLETDSSLPIRDLAVIWLAPNTLHVQSYDRLKGFYESMRDLSVIRQHDLTDTVLHPKEILFLNWSSIDKENNTFRRDNERNHNLQTLVNNTRARGTEILLVVDEAHLSYATGKKAKDVLMVINAKLEVIVTATPDTQWRPTDTVSVHREDAVNEQMIKTGVVLNPGFDTLHMPQDQTLDAFLLDRALALRQELEERYIEQGSNVRPLLLIQLPNDTQLSLSQNEQRIKDTLTAYLEHKYNKTIANKRLAIWLDNQKENVDGIADSASPVQVMLFKQAIAVGWDCPRAHVLLIYRELGDNQFTVQTVGRILRMPEQKHYADRALNSGYVFTNLSRETIQIVAEDAGTFETHEAKRIPSYQHLHLPSSYINLRVDRNRLDMKFQRCLDWAFEQHFGVRPIDLTAGITAESNRQAALASRLLDFSVENIEIKVPAGLEIDEVRERIIEVDAEHQMRATRNRSERRQLYERFCYDNCGGYAKRDSWPVLFGDLVQSIEYYFEITEDGNPELYKVVLHEQNKPVFEEVIAIALERFSVVKAAAAAERTQHVVAQRWDVPATLTRNDEYEPKPSLKCVLQPFLEHRNASQPERHFVQLLERYPEQITWWHKNGDNGPDNFAVVYPKPDGSNGLFYVDFIILFASGTLGFFDTKTKASDPEAPAKQQGLLLWMEIQRAGGRQVVGGILIPVGSDYSSWRYPTGSITNTRDLDGWAFFSPTL